MILYIFTKNLKQQLKKLLAGALVTFKSCKNRPKKLKKILIIKKNLNTMELIRDAILSGQRNVIVSGILFEGLPICPRETQKRKEYFATNKATELIKLLTN